MYRNDSFALDTVYLASWILQKEVPYTLHYRGN